MLLIPRMATLLSSCAITSGPLPSLAAVTGTQGCSRCTCPTGCGVGGLPSGKCCKATRQRQDGFPSPAAQRLQLGCKLLCRRHV